MSSIILTEKQYKDYYHNSSYIDVDSKDEEKELLSNHQQLFFSPKYKQFIIAPFTSNPSISLYAIFISNPRHFYTFDLVIRYLNLVLLILSFITAIVTVYLYQLCWDQQTLLYNNTYDNCPSSRVLRIILYALYIITILTLIRYYMVKCARKVYIYHYSNKTHAFNSTSLRSFFLLELIILSIHPLTLLIIDYTQKYWLIVIVLWLRSYLIVRTVRDFSLIYQHRFRIKSLNSQYSSNLYKIDYETVLKQLFYKYTTTVVLSTFLYVAVTLAYCVHLMEREYWAPSISSLGLSAGKYHEVSAQLKWYSPGSYTDSFLCFYWIIVTMTTLGYGDLVPISYEGKTLCMIATLIGIIFTSLLVGIVTNKLTPSVFQKTVIDYADQEGVEDKKRTTAALLIQRAWRARVNYKASVKYGEDASHTTYQNQSFTFTPKVYLSMQRQVIYAAIRPHHRKLNLIKLTEKRLKPAPSVSNSRRTSIKPSINSADMKAIFDAIKALDNKVDHLSNPRAITH